MRYPGDVPGQLRRGEDRRPQLPPRQPPNPLFNDTHPASTIPRSWSAAEMLKGATSTVLRVPTLDIWGMKDSALLTGHLSGLEKLVPNLSVKLYPDADHWIMLAKNLQLAPDTRRFIDAQATFPKESVCRGAARQEVVAGR